MRSVTVQGVWAPSRRLLTVGLVLMVTLVAFEALSVATILPVVSRSLGGIGLYGWVFSAFLLASLVGIAVAGSVVDRLPVAGVMLAGLVLFGLGLAVGGTAPSMPILVAGRAVQGLGAGAVPGTAYVVIARAYPPTIRPRMFAILSTAWVVPGLISPAIAASVASTVGWRWVFLGLLPIVAAAAVLGFLALRDVPPPDAKADVPLRVSPVLGVVLGAGVVLAALDSGSLLLAVLGGLAGAAVLLRSLRRLTPPGTLVARPGLPATILSRGLLTFGFFAGDAYVPYTLDTVRHAGTVVGGLAVTAATLTWTAGAWVQERRILHSGPRRLVRSGEVGVLAGLGLMAATLWPGLPALVGVGAWAVGGFGIGLAYSPLSIAALDRAPKGGEGRTTAGLQLTDVLGDALGTGVAGAAVAAGAHGLGASGGVGLAFGIAAAVAVVAVLVGVRLPARLQAGVPQPDPVPAAGGRAPAPTPTPGD